MDLHVAAYLGIFMEGDYQKAFHPNMLLKTILNPIWTNLIGF